MVHETGITNAVALKKKKKKKIYKNKWYQFYKGKVHSGVKICNRTVFT